jgi:hypothetical protein
LLADRLENHEGLLRDTVVDVLGRKEVKLPDNLVVGIKQVKAGEFNRSTAPIVNGLIARAPRTSFWEWARQRAGEDWVKVATTLGFQSSLEPNK